MRSLNKAIFEIIKKPANSKEQADIIKAVCFPDAARRLAEEAVKLKI